MPENAVPLANGWFAFELDEFIWAIFDENGASLGVMIFEDDDWDWEFVDFDNMIPLESFTFLDRANRAPPLAAEIFGENPGETPRTNPQTDDNAVKALIWIGMIFAIVPASAAASKKLRKNKI